MKESKEAALKKLEAVCKSESFQHMSKEGLKSSFGEYNKDNSEINKIKYDYNNNSIAHGTDTPYDAQKAHHMTQKADLEWEQAVVTDTPVHVAIGRTNKEGSNIQSQTQTKKKAALKMVKKAYESGALNEKAYNLAVRNINEGR